MKKAMLMMTAVAAAAMVPSVSVARDLAESVWFHADFDSPTTIAGEVFPFAMPTNYLSEGRFGRGYRFTCPGKGESISFGWRCLDARCQP